MYMRNLVWLLILGCNGPTAVTTKPFTLTVTDGMSPIAAAAVAVDDAKGKRLEKTTDAMGVAKFDIDWKQAPLAVTVYADGYIVHSRLGIAQTDSLTFRMGLLTPPAPTAHTISGQVLNLAASGDVVTLTASINGSYFQNSGPSYSFDVYEDKPFSIYALDWVPGTQPKRGVAQTFKKWVQIDAPAPSTSTTVDVDFNAGTALTPVRTSGTIAIPGGATGPLSQSSFYGVVNDADSNWTSFLGAPTAADVNTDLAGFHFDFEYVKPASVTKPLTRYFLSNSNGSYSAKSDEAWPTDSPMITDLPELPVVTNAASGLPLGTAPAFTQPTGDWNMELLIFSNFHRSTQKLLWFVEAQPGTPLAAPALPTGADVNQVLTGTISGQIVLCSPANTTQWCRHVTGSDPFPITR
jgi:hypothetical protein